MKKIITNEKYWLLKTLKFRKRKRVIFKDFQKNTIYLYFFLGQQKGRAADKRRDPPMPSSLAHYPRHQVCHQDFLNAQQPQQAQALFSPFFQKTRQPTDSSKLTRIQPIFPIYMMSPNRRGGGCGGGGGDLFMALQPHGTDGIIIITCMHIYKKNNNMYIRSIFE